MNSLVSIIVPVYNVEQYLEECIESIIHQSYQNLEIILVDDGSTDQSGTICNCYKSIDPRIIVIHKENGGLSDARNVGINVAKGKYIYFCDSDDYLDRDAIRQLYIHLVKMKAKVVVFDAYSFLDGDNSIKTDYIRKQSYDEQRGTQLLVHQIKSNEYKPCAYLSFFDASFLDSYHLRFRKGILHEDELFTYYLYRFTEEIVYLNEPLYYRRIREGSIMTSNNFNRRYQSMRIIFDEISFDDVEPCFQYAHDLILARISKSLIYDYRMLSRKEKSENIENYKVIITDIRKKKGYGDLSLFVRTYWWRLGVAISGIKKLRGKLAV